MKLFSDAAFAACLILVCSLVSAAPAAAQTTTSGWSNRDVGSPVLAGSIVAASGAIAIDGAGTGITGTRDQFHFYYQAVTGDFDLRARVIDITGVNDWAKAGVMVRSNLAADDAYGLALVSARKGTAFQRRTTKAGTTALTAGPAGVAPHWVRIVRTGTDLQAFTSPDGMKWVAVGRDTVQLGTTVYAGIVAASHDPTIRTTATFANLTVTPKASSPSTGQSSVDIGGPALAGSTSLSNGVYTISAAGYDVWGTSDEFHYVFKAASGDIDVKARVQSVTAVHAWSKVGVMIRETLDDDSAHATTFLSSGKGYAFQRRPQTGGITDSTGVSGAAPGWVRLVRTGTQFDSYRSADGVKWVKIASESIAMADSVLVGIAVTSHNTGAKTTAKVDGFNVTTASAPNQAPAVTLTSPSSNAILPPAAPFTMTATASDADGTVSSVDFYVGTTLIARDTAAPFSATVTSLAPGSYQLKAVATDDKGATTTSSIATVSVAAQSSTLPSGLAFTVGADHVTTVTSYRLEIHLSGATPGSSTPVATLSLGKPAPSPAGDVTVSNAAFFQGLAAGNYLASVVAIGPAGSTRSAAVTFTR